MTTRTPRSCRCRRLPESCLLAAGLAALLVAPAEGRAAGATAGTTGLSVLGGQTDAGEAPPAEGSQELYLDVELNQVPTGRLARFVLVDERLHASASTLRGLGLSWPGSELASGLVALDTLPGLEVQYDAGRQHVSLLATVALLETGTAHLGYAAPPPPRIDPATQAPGLIVNYDLYGQHDDYASSVSVWNELRVFGVGNGVFSSTGTLRALDPGQGPRVREALRLDTAWEYDDPARMVTVTVGDTLSGALSWTRPTRLGGIRVSRNFALQPYRITTPLASFAGEAVLPSTVDILINGIQQSSQQVQPGQFVIDSAPMLSGAGQAQLVITDINGQRRVLDFALYGTPQLLEPGLSDWSLELGAVRRRYGQASFDYAGDPVFSATGRRGLSERTTLEGHTQLSGDLQLAGLGGAWRLGERGGLFTAAGAGSRHGTLRGRLANLGYQWSSPVFNLFASSTRRSSGFRDVGSLDTGALPRRTDQVFLGFGSRLGQFGGSYLLQSDENDQARRYATLNFSRPLPRNGTLSLSYSRGLDDHAVDSAYLFVSLPLDRRTAVSATARHGRRSDAVSLSAHRMPQPDLGGWGWRAQGLAGDQRGTQAELTRLGQRGQWTLGANHWDTSGAGGSSTSLYASASGGLVVMRGHGYAMRRVDDAFALVDTNGFAGVPVRLENRVVGKTDAHGLLLVNRLNAWQANQLSIDPLDLPINTRLGETRIDAVPRSRSGLLAAFALHHIVTLELSLRAADGTPVAAGSPVWLDRGQAEAGAPADTIVGHDGLVWLADPPPGARLHVATATGLCSAPLAFAAGTGDMIDLGEITCQ